MTTQLEQRIDPTAKNVWRINAFIEFFIFTLVIIGYLVANWLWWSLPNWPAFIVFGFVMGLLIFNLFILPTIRLRIWSYQFEEDAVLIQSGLFIIKRTRVPMARIQHIDTEHGPVMRLYKLASLTITTAGTVHKIPALKQETAHQLAAEISVIAKVRDDDV